VLTTFSAATPWQRCEDDLSVRSELSGNSDSVEQKESGMFLVLMLLMSKSKTILRGKMN
jgi:hypothetical protein